MSRRYSHRQCSEDVPRLACGLIHSSQLTIIPPLGVACRNHVSYNPPVCEPSPAPLMSLSDLSGDLRVTQIRVACLLLTATFDSRLCPAQKKCCPNRSRRKCEGTD